MFQLKNAQWIIGFLIILGFKIQPFTGRYIQTDFRECDRPKNACPKGTYFDSKRVRCRKFDGGGKPLFVDYNTRCINDFIGVKAHPEELQFYYLCKSDSVIIGRCYDPEIFDNEEHRCKSPEPEDLNPANNLPPCHQAGRFPIANNCSLFYTCEMDLTAETYSQKLLHCPEQKTFSPLTQKCSSTYQCTPTQANSKYYHETDDRDKFPPCRTPGRFRSPFDCSLYYTCSAKMNGKFYQTRYKCPEGTLYDTGNQKCKLIRAVRCEYLTSEELIQEFKNIKQQTEKQTSKEISESSYQTDEDSVEQYQKNDDELPKIPKELNETVLTKRDQIQSHASPEIESESFPLDEKQLTKEQVEADKFEPQENQINFAKEKDFIYSEEQPVEILNSQEKDFPKKSINSEFLYSKETGDIVGDFGFSKEVEEDLIHVNENLNRSKEYSKIPKELIESIFVVPNNPKKPAYLGFIYSEEAEASLEHAKHRPITYENGDQKSEEHKPDPHRSEKDVPLSMELVKNRKEFSYSKEQDDLVEAKKQRNANFTYSKESKEVTGIADEFNYSKEKDFAYSREETKYINSSIQSKGKPLSNHPAKDQSKQPENPIIISEEKDLAYSKEDSDEQIPKSPAKETPKGPHQAQRPHTQQVESPPAQPKTKDIIISKEKNWAYSTEDVEEEVAKSPPKLADQLQSDDPYKETKQKEAQHPQNNQTENQPKSLNNVDLPDDIQNKEPKSAPEYATPHPNAEEKLKELPKKTNACKKKNKPQGSGNGNKDHEDKKIVNEKYDDYEGDSEDYILSSEKHEINDYHEVEEDSWDVSALDEDCSSENTANDAYDLTLVESDGKHVGTDTIYAKREKSVKDNENSEQKPAAEDNLEQESGVAESGQQEPMDGGLLSKENKNADISDQEVEWDSSGKYSEQESREPIEIVFAEGSKKKPGHQEPNGNELLSKENNNTDISDQEVEWDNSGKYSEQESSEPIEIVFEDSEKNPKTIPKQMKPSNSNLPNEIENPDLKESQKKENVDDEQPKQVSNSTEKPPEPIENLNPLQPNFTYSKESDFSDFREVEKGGEKPDLSFPKEDDSPLTPDFEYSHEIDVIYSTENDHIEPLNSRKKFNTDFPYSQEEDVLPYSNQEKPTQKEPDFPYSKEIDFYYSKENIKDNTKSSEQDNKTTLPKKVQETSPGFSYSEEESFNPTSPLEPEKDFVRISEIQETLEPEKVEQINIPHSIPKKEECSCSCTEKSKTESDVLETADESPLKQMKTITENPLGKSEDEQSTDGSLETVEVRITKPVKLILKFNPKCSCHESKKINEKCQDIEILTRRSRRKIQSDRK